MSTRASLTSHRKAMTMHELTQAVETTYISVQVQSFQTQSEHRLEDVESQHLLRHALQKHKIRWSNEIVDRDLRWLDTAYGGQGEFFQGTEVHRFRWRLTMDIPDCELHKILGPKDLHQPLVNIVCVHLTYIKMSGLKNEEQRRTFARWTWMSCCNFVHQRMACRA